VNRYSPRKWLLKKKKLTTRVKNKIWNNPQIKNDKNSDEFRVIRPQP
jgi:hypothetical protein